MENLRRRAAAEKVRDAADDEPLVGELNRWTETGAAVKRLTERYETASGTVHRYRRLRDETDERLDAALLSVETTDDDATTDGAVSAAAAADGALQRQVDELRGMMADAADAVGLDAGDAPLREVDRLNVKLERVRAVLAALGDVAARKDRLSGDVENARRLLHDVEKVNR